MKKVHILQSFSGTSKGKTKDLDDETAGILIADGTAILAEDGSEHPEPSEAEAEADSDETASKPGAGRKVKTDKTAEGADNK